MKINLKSKFVVLIIIFIILLVIFLVKSRGNKIVNTGPSPVPKVVYKNLELGVATRNDIVREIGAPLQELQKDNSVILEYQTRNPNFNDQYIIINNSLDFVREIITVDNPIRISNIKEKYGDYNAILYGPGSGISLFLYVYLNQGVAYIGHEKSGRVVEIWYFKPTDVDTFINKYARDYSKENQGSQ